MRCLSEAVRQRAYMGLALHGRLRLGISVCLAAAMLLACTGVQAALTVTTATGGTSISADKADNATSPAWTSLGRIVLTEPGGSANRCNLSSYAGAGTTVETVVIKAPTGWIFNTAQAPVITESGTDVTSFSRAFTDNQTLVVSLTVNACNSTDVLTIGTNTAGVNQLQVRAVDGGCVAGSGNIYVDASSTAALVGITKGSAGTSLGALSLVVGAASKFIVTVGGETFTDASTPLQNTVSASGCTGTSGNSGTATTQAAGTAFTGSPAGMQIRATDQFSNLVTTYTGAKSITFSGLATSPASTLPLYNGTSTTTKSITFTSGATAALSLTAYASGAQTIAVTDGTLSGTSSSVSVNSAALNNFLVAGSGCGPTPNQTPYSGTQASGVAFLLCFKARDAYGNTVTSFTSTVNLSVVCTGDASPTRSPATSAAFTLGVADSQSVTITTTGSPCVITATNGSSGSSGSITITSSVASFDVVEVGAARATPIYLKLAGTAFTLDVLALNSSNALFTTFAGTVTVELVDAASSGTCSAMTSLTAPVNLTFTSGTGRKTTAAITYANAAANAKVRIINASPSVTSCSADAFVIRPTGFTVDSTLNNAPTTKSTAGGSFTLTAATGTTAYTGTPQIVASSPIAAHAGAVATGTLSGTFGAAVSGTATGASFTYSEVGTFQFAAAAVYDSSFAAIDSAAGDCIANSNSNTPSGGKYGCNIANQSASAQFGRFYPAYFWLDTTGGSAPLLTDRSGLASCYPATTGSIAAASASLSVASAGGFAIGDTVVVKGAGAAGGDLVTTISAGPPGTTFTLAAAASTAAATTRVRKYGFTYMDETLTLSFRLSARNSIGGPPGAITQNYQGATYATLVTGMPVPANFNVGAISGGTDRSSRISTTLGLSGAWSAGTLDGVMTLSPMRAAAVDGPLTSLDIGINPSDNSNGDNVQINAAQRTLAISAVNYARLDRTDAYFGRLRMQNALGSPLLALTIPIEAQYFSGSVFQRNSADSCTSLAGNNFAVGNYLGSLTAVNTPASNLVVDGTFASGLGSLLLSKPAGGATGSADITVGLGATTGAQPCTTPSWSPTVTAAGAKSYLRYQWCGAANDRDPVARATFGAYRNNYIFRRENY